jgi:hypothetical protein
MPDTKANLKIKSMVLLIYILQFLGILEVTKKPPFEAQIIDANIGIGYGIALGDVDGDNKPDILLADKKQFVWYRNGDWKKFVIIENLTQQDNVCIAAKDVDGDGKVEVAVGAQWNPSETKDESKSGSVHFLIRPKDPTQIWSALKLYHEPTIHRMRWIQLSDRTFCLGVLPLDGIENKEGQGKTVNMMFFKYPDLLQNKEPAFVLDTKMHLTHNFQIVSSQYLMAGIYIAGKESVRHLKKTVDQNMETSILQLPRFQGAGEIGLGKLIDGTHYIATIESMHGNNLVVYTGKQFDRKVLDSNLKEGHALQSADLLGFGYDQIIAGWRAPNGEGKTGLKLYTTNQTSKDQWNSQWIDENGIACEDLQVMDLNGDGKLDIIASGRSTHNLKIYWNQTAGKKIKDNLNSGFNFHDKKSKFPLTTSKI